jgi:hypothetical protein
MIILLNLTNGIYCSFSLSSEIPVTPSSRISIESGYASTSTSLKGHTPSTDLAYEFLIVDILLVEPRGELPPNLNIREAPDFSESVY